LVKDKLYIVSRVGHKTFEFTSYKKMIIDQGKAAEIDTNTKRCKQPHSITERTNLLQKALRAFW
ncbi:hypothetical protein ACQCP9_26205, partial [Ralstonia pseudosolanacearum]|uniref:hypothetical protein n=1 Tax=Ralstonia pseudosolanacearum TaxID=1310165 RepID=UPI003CE753CC